MRIVLFVALLCGFMAPCGESFARDITMQKLTRHNQFVNLDISYPQVGIAKIDATIAERNKKKFASWVKQYDGKGCSEHSIRAAELQISYDVLSTPDSVVSLVQNYEGVSCGAHGYGGPSGMSFDAETGKQLKLEDLFAYPEKARLILATYCFLNILEESPNRNQLWLASGLAPTEDSYTSIAVSEFGIKACFWAGALGPYGAGPTVCEAPFMLFMQAKPVLKYWDLKAISKEIVTSSSQDAEYFYEQLQKNLKEVR